MSSVNPHYTMRYSQPSEYHFSHDSVFLARRVFEFCREKNWQPQRGLDLCAGCGIIGLDFLLHCQKENFTKPAEFDFLEVQNLYEEHFRINIENAQISECQTHFLSLNYDVLQEERFRERYDLIVCNPPYFYPQQGKLSPSEFKNRCRFFLDSNLQNLVKACENALALHGQAFILLREQNEHGWDIQQEFRKHLSPNFSLQSEEPIRGTSVVRLSRH